MYLLIMTRGRVGKQRTLQSIPQNWLHRTFLVCPKSEVSQHSHQCIPAPSTVTNYSEKFQFILNGEAIDSNKVVILDDDLVFAERVGDKLLRTNDPVKLDQMFCQIDDLLNTTALVSIHPRQMGHLAKLPYVENSKVICVQGINRTLCQPTPKVDQFPILADVMLNCTLLSRGVKNRLITTFVQDHGPCQAEGGCSIYRTPEMQAEAVRYIADKFAPYAKAVVKKPKAAKWMGDERVDLRVQWKRLYEAGVKRAGK
jgi:hypothetical protein